MTKFWRVNFVHCTLKFSFTLISFLLIVSLLVFCLYSQFELKMSFCSIIDMGLAFNAFYLICTCLQNKLWLFPAIFDHFLSVV